MWVKSPARAKWLRDNADKNREYKRRSANKAYAANPEKFRKRSRDWRQANQQRVRQRDRIYRRKYADKRKATFRAWREKNRSYYRQRNQQDVDGLAEWYVRAKLSRATCVKPSEWPASLVELMRTNLKIKRLLWQRLKTSPN